MEIYIYECSYIVATMKKAVQMSMEGYEMLEKTAVKGGNSGRIYVPPSWIGKRIRAVLIEQ
jgi:putative transposon-encoded protein